ncbi:hypothetical protein DBV15_11468 [Temnothorax longispinosus]|uniref:Uncharacterized protein n=1 Tax=Temnothorax longispinosus TaxID=300112 RepID=A0A4S2KLN5_9HYME|nr:hypothetical protein DBV15_11468 [Temnothorax longispinosus]
MYKEVLKDERGTIRKESRGEKEEEGGKSGNMGGRGEEEGGNKFWRVVFWNVAGLENKDKDFWGRLKKEDVLVMLETWIRENGWEKIRRRLPRGYEWEVQTAKRKNKKGRAIGRIIMGIRKGLKEKGTEVEIDREGLIAGKVRIGGERWSIIGELGHIMERKEERRFTIIGKDFNAKTEREGGSIEEEEKGGRSRGGKRSKDKKINKEGRLLMIVEAVERIVEKKLRKMAKEKKEVDKRKEERLEELEEKEKRMEELEEKVKRLERKVEKLELNGSKKKRKDDKESGTGKKKWWAGRGEKNENDQRKRNDKVQQHSDSVTSLELLWKKNNQTPGLSDLINIERYAYVVPLLKNLTVLLGNDELRLNVQNTKAPVDNVLKSVLDGSYYYKNNFFHNNKNALAIILYYDDLGIANPLGAVKHFMYSNGCCSFVRYCDAAMADLPSCVYTQRHPKEYYRLLEKTIRCQCQKPTIKCTEFQRNDLFTSRFDACLARRPHNCSIMPPKRSSGAEFRKRKRDKENENKKMSKVLISWTETNLNVSENCRSKSHIGNIKTSDMVDEICQEPEPTTSHHDQTNETEPLDTTNLDLDDLILHDESPKIPKALQPNNTSASLDENDPGSWFPLNDSIRSFLIEQGPDQGKESNFSLSKTTNNRKFSKEWFRKKLANGQFIEQMWLIYKNNLALRGSNEKIGEPGSGILLSAVGKEEAQNVELAPGTTQASYGTLGSQLSAALITTHWISARFPFFQGSVTFLQYCFYVNVYLEVAKKTIIATSLFEGFNVECKKFNLYIKLVVQGDY